MIQANYDSISSDKSEDSSDSEEYDEAKSVNCDINTVAIKCNHEVLPYSQILVNYGNCQLCCLVDLGAQISLITESRWRDLKNEDNRLRLCNSNNKILGVANSQANILGYAQIKLNIMTDTESVEIPFAIVKDSTIPCCVVLGINYIKRNAIIIDYENKRLVQTTSTGEEQYKSLNPRANELVQAKFNVPDFLGTVALDGNSTEEDDSDQGQEENSESENYRENLVPKFLISNEELRVMQNNNYALKVLQNKVKNNVEPKHWKLPALNQFKRQFKHLKIENNLLVNETNQNSPVVISFPFLVEVISKVHNKLSHIGRHKLVDCVKKHFWHPALDKVAREICSSCKYCQLFKTSHQTPYLKNSNDTSF
jgi:hypothetical protein